MDDDDYYADYPVVVRVLVLLGFMFGAGIPALAMMSETVACAIGAVDPYCPAPEDQ